PVDEVASTMGGSVKFTFWAPGTVASSTQISWTSNRQSRPDFSLRLFKLTRPHHPHGADARRRARHLQDFEAGAAVPRRRAWSAASAAALTVGSCSVFL